MADRVEVDQTAFPPRVARWEADGYDALRVVVDQLTHERDTLARDSGRNAELARLLNLEVERLVGYIKTTQELMDAYMEDRTTLTAHETLQAIDGVILRKPEETA